MRCRSINAKNWQISACVMVKSCLKMLRLTPTSLLLLLQVRYLTLILIGTSQPVQISLIQMQQKNLSLQIQMILRQHGLNKTQQIFYSKNRTQMLLLMSHALALQDLMLNQLIIFLIFPQMDRSLLQFLIIWTLLKQWLLIYQKLHFQEMLK